MHITITSYLQALLLFSWCESALGRLITKKRDVCVNDDFLLSFLEYPSDTVPFCSVYFNIQDITTSVISTTSRTFVVPFFNSLYESLTSLGPRSIRLLPLLP